MKLKKIIKILVIISLILIVIDQASKIIIDSFVEDKIELIPNNILTIFKTTNTGIAFGINKQNLGNIGLSLIVLTVIFKYIFDQKDNMNYRIVVFLSLIIAGGLSNVIDRIFKGAVFDFIKIGNFPIFNLADCFIVIRMDIICNKFYYFF